MKKLLLLLLCLPLIGFGQEEFYDSYNFIGFSADGFVAYELISFGQDEFGDNWEESKLNIQDLKTGEVVYSGGYEETILDEYNILLDDNIVFYSAESYSENSCNISLCKKMRDRFYIEKQFKELDNHNDKHEAYFLGVFYDFQSDINSDCYNMGEPPLYSKTHLVMGYNGDGAGHSKYIGVLISEECYEEFSYLGYYKSPFEMRIVLIFDSSKSYNSYDSSTNYKFIGCSLNPSTFLN